MERTRAQEIVAKSKRQMPSASLQACNFFLVLIVPSIVWPSFSNQTFNSQKVSLGTLAVATISIMVVQIAAVAPNPAPVRKNRRKISKKKAPRTADDEVDMDDIEHPTDGPSSSTLADTPSNETVQEDDDELMIDPDSASTSLFPNANSSAPAFDAAPASAVRGSLKSETRRVPIPPHRMSPLKKDWVNIFGPLTEILGLQVRMNVQRKAVEIRVRPDHARSANLSIC